MVMSLNFTAIEVKTINSVESWEGGVLVVVSGSVKTKEFSNRRSFVQTFFLAPQEKGYFVLSDVFLFVDEGTVYYHQPSYLSEIKHEAQLNPPTRHPDPQVSDYVLEEEASDYVNAVQIKDDLVDKYSLQEDQHQPQHEDYEDEVAIEETPREEVAVDVVHEHRAAPVEEPVGEKSKMSYASIVSAHSLWSCLVVQHSNKTTYLLKKTTWKHISYSVHSSYFIYMCVMVVSQ
jgi:hypothetical protein